MGGAETRDPIERIGVDQPRLWLVAILFFGLGDVITTGIGLGLDAVHEAGPLTGVFLDQFGLASMVVVKLAIFAGFYLLWRWTPRHYRIGIPFGLALLGVVVVWWNIVVQIVALQL